MPTFEGQFDGAVAEWLTSSEAAALLEEHAQTEPTPAAVGRLRRMLSADLAGAVLQQVELRRRAKAKFRQPEVMLFTRKGLEQATDEWIAEYKAQRFTDYGRVADLCCGIGGDLLGLAKNSESAIGVELDAASARFAEWNSDAPVNVADANEIAFSEFDAWHCDPDRRFDGPRTTRPELHSPSADTLSGWRQQNPHAAIKLAPAAQVSQAWSEACEFEWISRRGECRQLVLWSGRLTASPGTRRASKVFSDASAAATFTGDPSTPADRVESVGRYVFEPDAAVLAAGLDGALAQGRGLQAFTTAAYFTSESVVEDPLLAAFEVEEVLPLNRKCLSKWLAGRGVGRLEIKVRGIDLDPEKLRKELRLSGDEEATVLVAPDPAAGRDKPLVIVARRVVAPGH